jgi:hypothetical protein
MLANRRERSAMPDFAIYLIIFVFLILLMNFIFLLFRMRKNRSQYGRRGKKAKKEDIAAIARDREVYRRLDIEQMRIMKYLKLRARTWEMYEEVRQKHANDREIEN